MTLTTTSTIPNLLNTLQERLAARSGLAGVQIVSAPLGPQSTALESIQFGGVVESEQTVASLGNRRRTESYQVHGIIWIAKSGAGEQTIRAARDRAYELFAELEDELRADHTVGGTVIRGEIGENALDQGLSEQGARVARITYILNIETQLITR